MLIFQFGFPKGLKMRFTSVFASIITVLLASFAASIHAAELLAGPMVGATAMRQVKIWVQGKGVGTAAVEYLLGLSNYHLHEQSPDLRSIDAAPLQSAH